MAISRDFQSEERMPSTTTTPNTCKRSGLLSTMVAIRDTNTLGHHCIVLRACERLRKRKLNFNQLNLWGDGGLWLLHVH